MNQLDLIVVSYNNHQYLDPCVRSLLGSFSSTFGNILVVNNGEPESVKPKYDVVKVIDAGRNLGWEGGLKLGLQHSNAEIVCFLNDDTYFPYSSRFWVPQMMGHFEDPMVAGVGPSSNTIRGAQNIWFPSSGVFDVTYLIGLCFMIRRSDLDAAGGVDDTLPGGDDIDLSIRLRKLGKRLVVDKNVFVYHHLSTTGRREHADWDSLIHQESYNKALWEKHGLKELLYTYNNQVIKQCDERIYVPA